MMGKFPARGFHAKARVSVTLILILLLILVSHAARFVAAQPTVQTLPATNITDTSAHLEGQFNTNGQDTEYSFKLFDSSGAEIATCSSDIAPGSTGQFSNHCIAAGRQPSTTYGFAAMARWTGVSGASGDWQFGNILYFTTLASGQGAFPGPGAETDEATSVTDTSATLNGVVTTNGQDTFWMFSVSDANGGFVQNCPSGNLQFVPPSVGSQSVTCQASQLQPSTTYHFDLQACWQPAGTCGYGITLSFTTSTQMNTIFTNILTALHPVTDWAISNLRIAPSSPKVGDQLTFALDLTALNTNGPYPQSVGTNCWVDNAPPLPPVGASPNGGATTYYGPTGTPLTLTVNYPWTATAGTHTITCWVDPTKDPDTSNNKVSLTITVGSGSSTAFDFNVALSPSSESVNPGGTANYMVLLSYSDPSYSGTTINVQLTGLGPGMDYQLSPTGALTITTSPTTPTGTYKFTVVGSALGVTHQTSGALTVTQQSITTWTSLVGAASGTTSLPFDYSVTVSPSTQSAVIGGKTSYIVSVLPLGGSLVSVSLTVTGLPADVPSSFTVSSGNPPYSSTLNLDLSTSTANPGTYTLTVVASAGGNVKTATATLIIQPKVGKTTTSQTTTGGSGWLDLLQQNSLIVTAALLALAVVLGVLTMRGRRQHGAPQLTGSQVFCSKCGIENPASNEFCRGCGNKLNSSEVSEAG